MFKCMSIITVEFLVSYRCLEAKVHYYTYIAAAVMFTGPPSRFAIEDIFNCIPV